MEQLSMQIKKDLTGQFCLPVEELTAIDQETGEEILIFKVVAKGRTAQELMDLEDLLMDYWLRHQGDIEASGKQVIFEAEAA